MKALCETLGVARSNIAARATGTFSRARGRPPLPDADLVAQIKAVIEEMSTYGYLRISLNTDSDFIKSRVAISLKCGQFLASRFQAYPLIIVSCFRD